ncbi:hypothetical protein COCON_G00020130 [Conger conger]|uniref:ATP synthase subunit f, mitochondrial n=1 Tax=Conger conger TaxID=82655 RepID=A0A9Q1DWR6_CONCO|nr:hypothetical protein COCON_G00020130 [Conger conger]
MNPDERSEKGAETCPFCGRSFKRLKTHLARCKMAPVTKDTKLSRASEQLGLSAAAQGRGSAAKKSKKLAANQGVHGGRTPADLGEGGAKVRQNNKKSPPKGQGVSPGDGVKVNAHTDRGAAPVLPKPAGQRPGPIATATGGHTSDGEIAKRPLKLKLPESKLVPFSESPRGGAMARMQGAESALKRPPRARTLYVPGDHDQLPGPMGSLPSDSRRTERPPGWLLAVDLWQGATPPSEPHPSPLRSADWEVGRGPARPLGLEAVTELAVAYQGIGLSMVTLRPRPHPEPVQDEALPTRLPAPQSPGSLTDRVLMEVRLAELPDWLASRPLLSPRAAATAVQRGWRRYYRKYIDVRRGGVGGVAMLLAGYCVLSYMWSYPHLKRDRWRRYH